MTYYPVGKIEFCRNYSLHMAFLLYITYLREESIQCRGAFFFQYHIPLTNFMLARFEKNFVKTTLSQEKLLLRWFDEIFLGKWKFYSPYHSLEKQEIYSHWRIFSSNQLFSNFYSKNVAFTEFLWKKCESKLP